MGKKPFIDKKNARTFHVVHRSMRDPLAYDEDANQYVLKEISDNQQRPAQDDDDHNHDDEYSELEDDSDVMVGEAAKYGIYYEDQMEYDYLQHLREVGQSQDAVLIEAPKKNIVPDTRTDLDLPNEIFASRREIDAELYHGLKADDLNDNVGLREEMLDPDVRDVMEALSEAEEYQDAFDEDFIKELNAGAEDYEDGSDFNDDLDSDDLDFDSDVASISDDAIEVKRPTKPIMNAKNAPLNRVKKMSKLEALSSMSLSSSVLPRNDKLSLLDDQFDKVMNQYEDDCIGELQPEDTLAECQSQLKTSNQSQEQLLAMDMSQLESVMDEFLQDYDSKGYKLSKKR
ncbi:hypothetical protein MIR68_000224 [Amoeboaphelidium protococcarum]|nr:hypothetical protein MIR68_000224 [Amoeboaphelidium protococcarum]